MRLGARVPSCLALGVLASTQYEHEWHTPETYQWDLVTHNGISVNYLGDAAVWSPGKTVSFEACQRLCAHNTSCAACAWTGMTDAHQHDPCEHKGMCYFRSDGEWSFAATGTCDHTIGRKSAALAPPLPDRRPEPPLGYQPNIVFILTDDQDTILGRNDYTELGSLEVMPKLLRHLKEGGSWMRNAFVNTPICCPSRTEFMSGRYYHNIGPPNDPGGCMFVDTSNVARKSTGIFGLLASAGYEVGVFGKVTNDQGGVLKQMSAEGSMTWASAPLNYNDFYGMTYYRDFGNGTHYVETLSSAAPVYGTPYQSTQIGNRTLDWIDALRADPALSKKPFFAYIGPHAPHYPATPAPWHEHAFGDVTIPITKNYNMSCPDKTQHIRQNPPLSARAKCWEDQHFRDRWASLLSVDDMIDALVKKLGEHGLLKSTFIFFSSDHGYKQGQWRVGTSKQHPYETDIRVPLLARGPGIGAGLVFDQIAANVDITPTFLDLAGVRIPRFMDGRSMVPWLVSEDVIVDNKRRTAGHGSGQPWRDRFLTEYKSLGAFYNDHSQAWQDGRTTEERCGGKMPRGPGGSQVACKESEGIGDGNCYFIDSRRSNSWRALRVLNKNENLQYIEYDPTWKFKSVDATGAGLQHYELYDIDKDPYQMWNIYNQTSASRRVELHASISEYFRCKGAADIPSSCRDADRGVLRKSPSLVYNLV